MADDFNENDLVNLSGNEGTENSIPDAITDKFNEIFAKDDSGEGDVDVKAEDTKSPEVSEQDEAQAESNRIRRNERNRQAKEELEAEETAGEEAAESDTEQNTEGEAVADEEVAKEAADSVELDPALRFVAQEFGWTDDKINKLVAADPEAATETFTRLADLYTSSSRNLLNPGSPVAPGTQEQQQAAQVANEPLSGIDKLYANLQAFAEVNGQSLVDEFLTPLKKEVIDPVRQLMAEVQVQKQELNRTEARQTMGTLEQKFGDFYGKTDAAQTPVQKQNRAALGQLADQIRHASKLQGKELSIANALNRAHLLVTADHRERAVRSQIKEQVQKRAKTLTAKPTQRLNPKLVSAKGTDKAADAIGRFWADKGVDIDLD